jgi:uncharacterized protein (DUF2235 family)
MPEEEKEQEKATRPKRKYIRNRGENYRDVYVNSAQVRLGAFDVSLSLGVVSDRDDPTDPNIIRVDELVRVRMSPQHAKALLRVLKEHVERYEGEFGELRYTPKSKGETPDDGVIEVEDAVEE